MERFFRDFFELFFKIFFYLEVNWFQPIISVILCYHVHIIFFAVIAIIIGKYIMFINYKFFKYFIMNMNCYYFVGEH